MKKVLIIVVCMVLFIRLAIVSERNRKQKLVEDSAFGLLSEVENISGKDEFELLLKDGFLKSYNECLDTAKKDNININDNTKTSCIYMSTLEYDAICSVVKPTPYSSFCSSLIGRKGKNLKRQVQEYDYELFNLKK